MNNMNDMADKINVSEGTISFKFQTTNWNDNKVGIIFNFKKENWQFLLLKDEGNFLRFSKIRNESNNELAAFIYVGNLSASSSHHITLTWSNKEVCIYVDADLSDCSKKKNNSNTKIYYSDLYNNLKKYVDHPDDELKDIFKKTPNKIDLGTSRIAYYSVNEYTLLFDAKFYGINSHGMHYRLGSIYKVYRDVISEKELKDNSSPIDIFKIFIDKFGEEVEININGENIKTKFLIDESSKLIFLGMFNEVKYSEYIESHKV